MRRTSINAAIFIAACLTSTAALAEAPNGTIKIVIGYAPGGSSDLTARWYATKLSEKSGSPVIVENRTGNAGNLATEFVAKSVPDGRTLLMSASGTLAGSTYLIKNLPFDVSKDLAPIAPIFENGFALVVNPAKVDVTTAKALADFIGTKAGKATYGWGTSSALAASVLFLHSAKTEATSVAYKSTVPAVDDLMAGEIDFAFADMPYAMTMKTRGKLRILATNSPKRTAFAPDVITLREAGYPEAEMHTWMAFWAPAGTPASMVSTLSDWVNEISRLPETRTKITESGADSLTGSPDDLKRLLADSLKNWKAASELTNMSQ